MVRIAVTAARGRGHRFWLPGRLRPVDETAAGAGAEDEPAERFYTGRHGGVKGFDDIARLARIESRRWQAFRPVRGGVGGTLKDV